MLRSQAAALAVTVLLFVGAVRADEVWLKNGVYLVGTVKSMTDGELEMSTPWAGDLKLKWSDIENLKIEGPLPLVLVDESRLVGQVTGGEGGVVGIRTEKLKGRIRLGDVASINPPEKEVSFKGFIRGGAALSDGNTRTREASAAGELQARSEKLRLLLKGQWRYGENLLQEQSLFKRNVTGEIKIDFFVFTKAFLYANTFFESDKFKDLNLRTAMGAGGGYQWYEEEWLSVYTEVGLSYVVDDRKEGVDGAALSSRLAWKVDWRVIEDFITFFHNGELFQSVEDVNDHFINTSTGMRFTVFAGFFASIRVDFNYDTTPTAGFRREDVKFVLALGYSF